MLIPHPPSIMPIPTLTTHTHHTSLALTHVAPGVGHLVVQSILREESINFARIVGQGGES